MGMKKLGDLEVENKQLKKVTDDLKALVLSLSARVDTLEGGKPKAAPAPAAAGDDDDDVDLFGSDDEEDDEEKKRITEERLKAYNEKKAKKPKVIAKTSVLFDVKPWDDETDMEAMKGLQEHRDGGSGVGCHKVGSCGLWNQQTPDHVHCGRRQSFHRRVE